MPKPKAFLQSKNKKKKDEPVLETADDYQAAGVDFEEAAGKHRAGDPVKSLRFFQRAINTYDEGLMKFPQSFDLAYNKARVQYEVATHPKLAKELRQPLVDLLKIALASHEYALRIDENDADLLFNTSQVLTSIAEELANAGSTEEAIELLRSALKLQARCLSTQEQRYLETLEQEKEAHQILEAPQKQEDTTEGMDGIEQSDGDSVADKQEEQWASVLEPVTTDTIIDTICACFGTMTTLCTTIGTSRYPLWRELSEEIESQYKQLLGKMQDLSLGDPARMHEAALADAILQSAIFDLSFNLDEVLSAARYKSLLDGLWSTNQPHLHLEANVDALTAYANALITFNFSLSTQNASAPNVRTELANSRWVALTQAIKSLAKASGIPSISADEKAKTHLLRGDASLLQYRMSSPAIHPQAVANAAALLKNAKVFYRNAAQLSSDPGDKEHALFRCAIVQNIQDPDGANRPALGAIFADEQERRAAEELQDMLDEGLVMEQTDANGLALYA